MRLTPLDIREQQFRRVMRGEDPEEVATFLASVATEFENLLAENKELRQRLIDLEEKLNEYRNLEKGLRDTLLTAERVMTESKESAQREAALIVREAENAAQRATARISHDVAQLRYELSEMRRMKDAYLGRLRWLARSHLEMIEGQAQEFVEVDAGIGPMEAPPSAPSAQAPTAPRGAHEGAPGDGHAPAVPSRTAASPAAAPQQPSARDATSAAAAAREPAPAGAPPRPHSS